MYMTFGFNPQITLSLFSQIGLKSYLVLDTGYLVNATPPTD